VSHSECQRVSLRGGARVLAATPAFQRVRDQLVAGQARTLDGVALPQMTVVEDPGFPSVNGDCLFVAVACGV
jgi:hypothetical protein